MCAKFICNIQNGNKRFLIRIITFVKRAIKIDHMQPFRAHFQPMLRRLSGVIAVRRHTRRIALLQTYHLATS